MQLQPNYIVDNCNNKIAVQLDIKTYEKITEVLENYALFKYMEENKDGEKLLLEDAKKYYNSLKEKSLKILEVLSIFKFLSTSQFLKLNISNHKSNLVKPVKDLIFYNLI